MNDLKLAKVERAELVIEDHGFLTVELILDYGGSAQGVPGYILTGPKGGKFLMALLNAFAVSLFSDIKGRHIMAIIENGMVVGLEPLPMEKGRKVIFDDVFSDS